jgi:4-amino-4-deoxy-L-arabinose transferase-like glycosyltransferase
LKTQPHWLHNQTLRFLVLVVALYLLLGSFYLINIPALEKPDEEWHYAYVVYLLDKGKLPPISTDETINPAQQEAGQPPLYYLLAATTVRLFGLNAPPLNLTPNPYWGYPSPGTVNDNKNRYIHPPNELFSSPLRTLLALRVLSLLLGIGTILSVYGLARVLGLSWAIALASSLAVVFLPQYLFITTSVSNDGLVTTLSSLALWALVVAVQREHDARQWGLFGALAGLAALTKLSALLLPVLGVMFAVLLGWRRRSIKIVLIGSIASISGVLLLNGWWYVHNLLAYGDPLGIGIHFSEVGRGGSLSLSALITQWQDVELSFWAAFGWGNVHLNEWFYKALRVVSFLGTVGLIVYLFKDGGWRRANVGLWAVLVYVAMVGASLAWWTQSVSASLGRLLFPALAALMILLVLGLASLWRWLPVIVLGGLGLTTILSSVYLVQLYQPPTLSGELSPNIQPLVIRFDDLAELTAFDVNPRRVMAGGATNVTLCWRALEATSENYSVLIQILGEDNAILGARRTYPGLGSFATSLWRVGDRFCDQISVPINPDVIGSGVYEVEIGMFDPAASDRLPAFDTDGNPIELIILDRIKIVGAKINAPSTAIPFQANFANKISLTAYELGTAPPGEPLPITFYWQALSEIQHDYTLFVHLFSESDELVSQTDSPPQAGRFHTHWWEAGDLIPDTKYISLPPDLEPGNYRLSLGWYWPETGERLPLSDQTNNTTLDITIRIGD